MLEATIENNYQNQARDNAVIMERRGGPVGRSTEMEQVREMIAQVAVHDTSVLLCGESGSGKEVIAKNIHNTSSRKGMPFVPVNCGAIPPDLLESEMFGHEKGAFTGAISARKGRFEIAEGGTLFLDEIGDMSLPMQVKLLRVLQERQFERVGSNKPLECNVRIIAATHRNLEKMIEEGTFRQDLYFRLNVFPIYVPALRERLEDLPELIDYFVKQQEHAGRSKVRLSRAAIVALNQYQWPGNVRELANLIERLSIIKPGGFIRLVDLPEAYRAGIAENDEHEELLLSGEDNETSSVITSHNSKQLVLPEDGIDLKQFLADLEQRYIMEALNQCDGVVAKAARLLKMRRTTLVEKMRKLEKNTELTA